MIKWSIFFVFVIFSFRSNAKDLHDFINLDTILYMPATIYKDKLAMAGNSNEIWFYVPALREDTLDFEVINLSNYSRRTVSCPLPSMYFKIRTPQPYSFDVSDQFICLFVYRTLILIERQGDLLKLKSLTPINESIDFMKIKGDLLYFGKHYNSHPNDSPMKTVMAMYNLKTEVLEEIISPKFNHIEFSHFERNKWVDFTDGLNIFSQSTSYSFNLYDDQLNLIDSLTYKKKDWHQIDPAYFNEILKQHSSAKSLIELLRPLEDTLKRIELVYFVNNHTLIIEHSLFDKQLDRKIRKVDIWTKNDGAKFALKHEDLEDLFNIHDQKITIQNYPIALYNNQNLFYDNKLCQWNFGTPIYPIGLTYDQIKPLSEDYIINNDQVYVLKFFNCSPF